MIKSIYILDSDKRLREAFRYFSKFSLPLKKHSYLFFNYSDYLMSALYDPSNLEHPILIGVNNNLRNESKRGIEVIHDISKFIEIPCILYSDEEHSINKKRAEELKASAHFILSENSKGGILLANFLRRFFPDDNSSCRNNFISVQ